MGAAEHWLVRTRAPRGQVRAGGIASERDADALAAYLQDAARYPGGHTDEISFPTNEAEVAALAADPRPLLVVGAQSSLTGGATPRGERLVSTSRLREIGPWTATTVTCGAGVVLRELDEACAAEDAYFPPVPTYDGATVGGVVSTDAAGAATFKHGTTRAWVDGLTVVLASGEVLDLERGRTTAHPDGWWEIETLAGARVRIPVPRVAAPGVPKVSAGYRGVPRGSAPNGDAAGGARPHGMDLVDLFVGSEGTLGIVTGVRLGIVRPRPAWLAVLVPVAGDAEAIALTRDLRDEALRARREGDAAGADVAAIEYMDARCVEILREDGVPARAGVTVPDDARALLLVQLELAPSYDRARAHEELASSFDDDCRGPIAALCRILDRHGVLETAVPALPGEDDRRRALFALREAVPEGVNARVRAAALGSGEPVSKSGGDVIVPFERLGEALAGWRGILASTGLEAAVWGHISDGNMHPNLVATDGAAMEKARAAQVAIGELAIALGGSPLAEHGTGRNPAKKRMLAAFHGDEGVASMRETKRALDPEWKLAPGVLFDAPESA